MSVTCGIAFIVSATLIAAAEPSPQQANQGATAQSTGKAAEESPNDLFLNVGKSVLVDSSLPIERVSIGFGDVAEATAVGPQEVLVNGKAAGADQFDYLAAGGRQAVFRYHRAAKQLWQRYPS